MILVDGLYLVLSIDFLYIDVENGLLGYWMKSPGVIDKSSRILGTKATVIHKIICLGTKVNHGFKDEY